MIKIKSSSDIKKMMRGGQIANFTIKELARNIKPGITTLELDAMASRIIKARGAEPSFLGYQGFPGNICVSINDELVHGVPSSKKIKRGDIVKIDLGVFYQGFHTDMARTYTVGAISDKEKKMVDTCRRALEGAINLVAPGNTIGDIEYEIGKILEDGELSPLMSLTGHGIGRNIHEKPSIFCDGVKGTKEKLVPGMVIAVEPMATTGSGKVKRSSDNWTILSEDKTPGVHFEDTIAVTARGHRVLTRTAKGDNLFL